MKVSVIVPAYNAEKFIKKSLDSIINQVYKNLEIIIVDDASTDNTKKIIKEYADKDKRIIPFYQTTNKGVSSARNLGMKAVTGDYVMFVDSDDELTKDAIRRMVDIADKYNADFVDSYHLLFYKKKNGKECSFTEKKMPKEHMVLGSLKDDIRVLDTYMYITGKLIKKELLDNIEFDENLSRYEDLVFEHKIKAKLKNYCLINKPTYFYYQREDSLVNTLGKKHLCYLDAAREVKQIYINFDKKIQDKVESMLFTNALLTLFTKVIKNNDSIEDNKKLIKKSVKELIEIFPNYKQNKYINKFLKNKVEIYLNDDKKLEKLIKKAYKTNFIALYFNYLSIVNKYKYKNPFI